jgi:hypothetical protein
MSVGAALLVVNLLVRQFRSEGIQAPDIFEAVGVAGSPILLPGAIEMMFKAFGGEALPIFNRPEDRLALFIGGAVVLTAIAYGNFLAFGRAWKNQRS